MLDLQQTSDQTKKKLKETKEETSELGKAFTDAVENGMRALAAYASFNALKSGIVNAQQFNRQLTIQAGLWGQNANEINSWGKAVKQAGGDAQGFLSWYDSVRKAQAAVNRKALPLDQTMAHIRGQVRGQTPEMAQNIFQQYGLNDAGAQALLMGSDEEWEKTIAKMRELTAGTNDGASASQQFGKSWDNATTALQGFFTTVNTVILPPLSKLLDGMTEFFSMISENKAASTGFFVAMAAAATAFTASIPAIIAGFGSISAAALSALPVIARFAGAFGAIAVGAGALVEGSSAAGTAIGHWINRRRGLGDANGVMAGQEGYSGGAGGAGGSGSAMDYLMKTYNLPAHTAAGVVANMQHESGFDPNARGDGGMAHGLFQWHPDRRAKIFAGTGIDVSNASPTQQMDAMMWELRERGQLTPLLGQKNAYDAASYFSQRFEVPANGLNEAMKRGMTAMDIAGSTPFASSGGLSATGGSGVQIDKIEVHTQATDSEGIARDIGSALQRQIGGLIAQNNDGVAY